MNRPVSVFVVDDSSAFRRAAVAVVEATEGFEFAGEASNGTEAIRMVGESASAAAAEPALVLMDVRLGSDSGVTVTREILSRRPNLVVVLVSTMDEADLPADLLDCGAHSFLHKTLVSPGALRLLWKG